MIYFNFNKYKLSNKDYGGSEKKVGLLIDDEYYMIKFQKRTPFKYKNNTISEYIGSHIFSLLGFSCQETYLGTYNGKQVVACKDFVEEGYQFIPFNDIGESTIEEDKDKYQYSYSDIVTLLERNKKLTNVNETISSFFEIFIVDALLGNFDRHGGNWGFLKKNNKYYLAPVFDNGSCLFPSITNEDEIDLIINDEEEINDRIYKFPTSQILLDNKKSSYFDVISSLKFKEVNKALIKIYPKINISKINALIDDITCINDKMKKFYKTMIKARYEKIIQYAYRKLMRTKNEKI